MTDPRLDDLRAQQARLLSPRQRWGTCCPRDPHCAHSHLDIDTLRRWMGYPITDEHAHRIEQGAES